MDRPWTLARRLAATWLVGALLGCGGQVPIYFFDDLSFYRMTAILVAPAPEVNLALPGAIALDVTVVYLDDFGGAHGRYHFKGLEAQWDELADVSKTEDGQELSLCAPEEVPPSLVALLADSGHLGGLWSCVRQRFTLAAGAQAVPGRYPMHLTAEWQESQVSGTIIQRVAEAGITFTAPADALAFNIAVDAPTTTYPTGADNTAVVRITRADNSSAPIALEFVDPGGNGLIGRFDPNPATGDASQLTISAPSRLARGGSFPAVVRATRGDKTLEAGLAVVLDPLFTVALPDSALATFTQPALVAVELSRPLVGGQQLHLSVSGLPPGTTARFEPDADPDFAPAGTSPSLTRTLRVGVTDPGLVGSDLVQIRATAGAAADAPFIEQAMLFYVAAVPQPAWQFFAGYVPDTTDGPLSIGLAMRSDDLPVVAQLESPFDDVPTAHPNHVVVTRFDGVGWLPEPAGPVGPVGAVGSASFALASGDVPMVAYTDASGSQLIVVTANAGHWATSGNLRGVALTFAHTPQLACGAGGQCALAWVERDSPLTGSDLVVKRQASRLGGWNLMAGPNPRRSLNHEPDGRVLPGSVALSIDPAGVPSVAWLEVGPAAGATPVLWMRTGDGAGWGPEFLVPAMSFSLASRVRLASDASGNVIAAWTEGSPARLMAARYAGPSRGWQMLPSPITSDGALNVVDGAAASDFSIALEADGNPVVAWAEGGLKPDIWAKRWNGTTWQWIGSSVDGSQKTAVAPQIAIDSRREPHVAFTFYSRFDDDLTKSNPITEIQVARWR